MSKRVFAVLAIGLSFLATAPAPAGIIEKTARMSISVGDGGTVNTSCNYVDKGAFFPEISETANKHVVKPCGRRAELAGHPTEIGATYWYGWRIYLPSDFQDRDKGYDIVNQWAAYPVASTTKFACGGVGSHNIIEHNKLFFQLQGPKTDNGIDGSFCRTFHLASVSQMRGKWVTFVMQAKWTAHTDGFVKLWLRLGKGSYVQKVDYIGRTYWREQRNGPYFKMGVYEGSYNAPGNPGRTLYTNSYILGDANSSFTDVSYRGVAP